MKRSIRLSLLFALVLTASFTLLRPTNAEAFTPTCQNGPGHYGPQCYPLYQGSCRVGTMCHEWDCQYDDGVLHPTNVTNTPYFCGWYVCCP